MQQPHDADTMSAQATTFAPDYFENTLTDNAIPMLGAQSENNTTDPVPGCGALGMGFDIRKKYFIPSLCQSILDLGPATGKFRDYTVPENVRVIESGRAFADFKTVSSREEFNSTFASKAGLTISGFAFDGEFNAAFKEVKSGKAENFYSFYQFSSELWSLAAIAKEPTKAFTDAVAALPTEFNPKKSGVFFNIFKRFGTHYIDNITMGGNLVMYTAISSTEGYTEKEFSASMKLEYEGLFTSASGEASTKWKEVNEKMFKEQTFNLFCNGGDASLATAGITFNANYNEQFVAWQRSCEGKPSIVGYNLTPIAFAAPLAKQQAILAAIDAYTKGTIHSTASVSVNGEREKWSASSDISIYAGGRFITPPQPTDNPNKHNAPLMNGKSCQFPYPVFRVTMVSPSAPFKIIGDKVYHATASTPAALQTLYDEIYKDIEQFSAKAENKYFASFAASAGVTSIPPNDKLVHWLKSIGAGKVINMWLDSRDKPYGDNNVGFYTCAGKSGALENSADEDWYSVILYKTDVFNKRIKADSMLVV